VDNEKEIEPNDLDEMIKSAGKYPFKPFASYDNKGDIIEARWDDCSYYAEWINHQVTLLRHNETGKIIGVQIWALNKDGKNASIRRVVGDLWEKHKRKEGKDKYSILYIEDTLKQLGPFASECEAMDAFKKACTDEEDSGYPKISEDDSVWLIGPDHELKMLDYEDGRPEVEYEVEVVKVVKLCLKLKVKAKAQEKVEEMIERDKLDFSRAKEDKKKGLIEVTEVNELSSRESM
jgi:hypothetical protein